MFELRGRPLIGLILILSGLQFTLVGFDQGLFGGILAGERFQDMLGHPNPTMSGLVTAIYDIGCALGTIVAFIFGEQLGRKRSIILANFIVIVGASIQTASFSYAQVCSKQLGSPYLGQITDIKSQMFVTRIITGIGVGLSTVAIPILQSGQSNSYLAVP